MEHVKSLVLIFFLQACGFPFWNSKKIGTYDCPLKSETLVLGNGSKSFPAVGRFVEESHLATSKDSFSDGRLFPNSTSEEITQHLNRSCGILRNHFLDNLSKGCPEVYKLSHQKEWTPPEGGAAGQGSVANLRPSPEQEMWSANMLWTSSSKPSPGDKWLIQNQSLSVVVAMGFETGPGSATYLGGIQPEVRYYLGSSNTTQLNAARLEDQSLPYGPVVCK